MADEKKPGLEKVEEAAGVMAATEAPRVGVEKNGTEKTIETAIETAPAFREKAEVSENAEDGRNEGELGLGAAIGGQAVDPRLRDREKEIENILEKDLAEAYLSLDQGKRREFKIAGERTAEKINLLLEKTAVKAGNIIALIKKWLSLIPGMNKFFLEQEAKLKADEIIKLRINGDK